MSNDWDANWWRKAKAESIQRKSRQSSISSGDTFLLVTEGTVTEPTYFKALRAALRLRAIKVVVAEGDTSAPRSVVETAARLAKEQKRKKKRGTQGMSEPDGFDQVWAVIDTDAAVRDGVWHEVEVIARKHHVKLAYSTPCFEFWLLLHLCYCTPSLGSSTSAEGRLQEELGYPYEKNSDAAQKVTEQLLPKWPDAVKHAQMVRKHHEQIGNALPANPSTDVDRLTVVLNVAAAPPYQQRLE
jgi:hypothetical protein